jgi:O-antigen/teichoic acid export membrane protein
VTAPGANSAPEVSPTGRAGGWLAATYRRARRPGTLARELAATATTNIGLAVIGGAGGILLARALGPADRGYLVTLVQWPALACTIASLGITQAATYRIGQRPADKEVVVSTGTALAFASGAVVAAAGPLLAHLIGRADAVQTYLMILFLLGPMTIAAGLWNSALQAVHIGRFNLTRATQPVAYFVCAATLYLLGQLRLGTAAASLVAAQILAFAVAYFATRTPIPIGLRVDRTEAKALYRYGLVVFVGMLPRIVNVRLDLLILSVVPSIASRELGIYAVAASLTWLVLPVAVSFGTVAFPRLARRTDRVAGDRIQRVALRGSLAVASTLVLGLAVSAPWVIPLLFGNRYRSAVHLVWLLCPGTVCLALNQVMGDILRGRGRPSYAIAGEVTAAVVTVAGLAAFTGRYGTTAAAVVSSVAYAATSVVLGLLLRRSTRIARSGHAGKDAGPH